MDLEEAKAWLLGKRSTCNYINEPENSAIADAGYTQQAYWIVKAHKEGLV